MTPESVNTENQTQSTPQNKIRDAQAKEIQKEIQENFFSEFPDQGDAHVLSCIYWSALSMNYIEIMELHNLVSEMKKIKYKMKLLGVSLVITFDTITVDKKHLIVPKLKTVIPSTSNGTIVTCSSINNGNMILPVPLKPLMRNDNVMFDVRNLNMSYQSTTTIHEISSHLCEQYRITDHKELLIDNKNTKIVYNKDCLNNLAAVLLKLTDSLVDNKHQSKYNSLHGIQILRTMGDVITLMSLYNHTDHEILNDESYEFLKLIDSITGRDYYHFITQYAVATLNDIVLILREALQINIDDIDRESLYTRAKHRIYTLLPGYAEKFEGDLGL